MTRCARRRRNQRRADKISSVDPDLVESWLRARSIARDLPQPVWSRGGLCVETNSDEELRRYIFARPCEELRLLAAEIDEPRILLKLSDTEQQMRALLDDRWELVTTSNMMVCDHDVAWEYQVPTGYQVDCAREGDWASVTIHAEDGSVAAQGRAAEYAGVYCYDQIRTADAHQRKGLGRVVMGKLREARESQAVQQILTATPEGRSLYLALGWKIYSPWMTANIRLT